MRGFRFVPVQRNDLESNCWAAPDGDEKLPFSATIRARPIPEADRSPVLPAGGIARPLDGIAMQGLNARSRVWVDSKARQIVSIESSILARRPIRLAIMLA